MERDRERSRCDTPWAECGTGRPDLSDIHRDEMDLACADAPPTAMRYRSGQTGRNFVLPVGDTAVPAYEVK
jgi:hypothetical protein